MHICQYRGCSLEATHRLEVHGDEHHFCSGHVDDAVADFDGTPMAKRVTVHVL